MAPPTDRQIRVLVVDDDPALLNVIGLFLESTGEIITTLAHRGGEALDRIESEHFDVCVSDLEMPGMDGIRLLKEVRYRGMDLPCILITGSGHGDVTARARTAGVNRVIRKVGEGDNFFQKLIEAVRAAAGRGEKEHPFPEGRRERSLSVHA
ncbi:response regulator [Methanofollis ethanolicus]|uniref:response regulator n=1 Tax=Methanofollis ethanolicus TaxID=488124 RepID=UPI00083552C9|nr:response regulator [Methanofollis ethanolicus]